MGTLKNIANAAAATAKTVASDFKIIATGIREDLPYVLPDLASNFKIMAAGIREDLPYVLPDLAFELKIAIAIIREAVNGKGRDSTPPSP
jgi:hypothetical protein